MATGRISSKGVDPSVSSIGDGAERIGRSEEALAIEKKIADFRRKVNKQFANDLDKQTRALIAMQKASAKEIAALEKKEKKELNKQYLEVMAKSANTLSERMKASAKLAITNVTDATKEAVKGFVNGLGNDIKAYADQFARYQSSWNTRLQGTEKTFQDINGIVTKNLAASPYIKMDEMLDNLNTLIGEGIAYNVEQRAFLMSVTDKIATTFDVNNSTLRRLIRIQQADSTQARLGMEAYITNFLNATYQDTSYLSNTARSVSEQLLEVSSNLTRNDAVELEFVVQKWLGSLGSVGVSESLLTTLAAGINALGTGDIGYFSSNQALQNLFVMGAARGGVSYAEALTEGIKADAADAILRGIVSYLQEIATTDNQVIKSTYANLFGTSVSDLNSVLNLINDLDSISKVSLSYEGAEQELQRQLGLIGDRMHIGEQMSNLFDNMVSGIARGIANSPGMYATWVVNDFIEKMTGGINIPFVSALGTGIDLNANVNQLIKLGLVGVSTLGQVGNIINSLQNQGGLNLGAWGYQDITSRGEGFRGIKSGASVGTSSITYIGSTSSSDIYQSTLGAAYEKAEEDKKITGQGQEGKNTEARIESIDTNTTTMTNNLSNIDNNVASILTLLQNSAFGFTRYNDSTTNT